MKLCTIIFCLIICIPCLAFKFKNIKLRAREHFEFISIERNNISEKYSGFSNSINLWYEKPYDYSLGLVFTPIISSMKAQSGQSLYGGEVDLLNIGIDSKYFPKVVLDQLFLHVSFNYSTLTVERKLKGYSFYLGSGYEIPFKTFGLALEVAYRYSHLDDNYQVKAIIPSIGFHFYDLL